MSLFLVDLGISTGAPCLRELIPEARGCPLPALTAPRSATEATCHQPEGCPPPTRHVWGPRTCLPLRHLALSHHFPERDWKTHDVRYKRPSEVSVPRCPGSTPGGRALQGAPAQAGVTVLSSQ